MIHHTRYSGHSGIANALCSSHMAFATSILREPTFFEGELAKPVLFREAMGALYQVVVADYKYHPRDRVEFFAWLAEQDRKFLASLGYRSKQIRERIEAIEVRIAELDETRDQRLQPFYRARRNYFEYAYHNAYEMNFLLDPVITVHPDELSFEAFSRDESIYARVAAKYDIFREIGSFECGTTNIDFSTSLHGEMQRMRSYRQTRFTVDPSGFAVASEEKEHKEKKIELPESWLLGFLQVHSTMTLGLTRVRLAPADLFNICRFLRRHKAKVSPRALRWELTPGEPARVVLEPWEHAIELSEVSRYEGAKAQSIRTWGRDRLQVLGRLLPVCQHIDVYLAGFGMPTIYVADLGPILFTFALSGWTDNDWTGKAKFDLLSRPMSVNGEELMQVYQHLRETRYGTESALAMKTGLSSDKARSALSYLCQVGRAMYDLASGVYRHRDLLAEPFTLQQAAAVTTKASEETDDRAKLARAIFDSGNVRIIAHRPVTTGYKVSGSAAGADGFRVRPLMHIGQDGHIIEAECTCRWAKDHKLTQGPCEHILALRLAHMSRLDVEGRKGADA